MYLDLVFCVGLGVILQTTALSSSQNQSLGSGSLITLLCPQSMQLLGSATATGSGVKELVIEGTFVSVASIIPKFHDLLSIRQ